MEVRKTRAEWLKLIPLQIKLQIIEAARKDGNKMKTINNNNHNHTYNLFEAFASLFTFRDSKQGHTYWFNKLMKMREYVGK